MKGYQKHLAKVITLGLLLSSGGVVPCAAADDYNSDQTLQVHGNTKLEFENVSVSKTDADSKFLGIDIQDQGNTAKLTVNGKISISAVTEEGGQDVGYTGVYMNCGNVALTTVSGIDIAISSLAAADNNCSKTGLFVAAGNMDLGQESNISIDTRFGDSKGIYLQEQNDYYKPFKGEKLNIAINQNIAVTETQTAYGIYSDRGANNTLAFDAITAAVKAVDTAAGMYIETADNKGDNNFNVKQLVLQAEATAGTAYGLQTKFSSGSTNNRNSKITSEGLGITARGAQGAHGLVIDKKFDVTVQNLVVDAQGGNEAIGVELYGSPSWGDDPSSLTVKGSSRITVKSELGQATGIVADLSSGDYGNNTLTMSGTNSIAVTAKTEAVGIVTGDKTTGTFGVTVIDVTSTEGDAYGVKAYGAEGNGSADFNKDLAINTKAADGKLAVALEAGAQGTITVGSAGSANNVNISGDIMANDGGKINAVFGSAASTFTGSSKKDGNTNSKIDLNFAAAAKWAVTGTSDVDNLTVGQGTLIDMNADQGGNSTLTVKNLKGSGADFIMDVNKDGHDAFVVTGAATDGKHSVQLNVNGVEALKNLAASDQALISTDNDKTEFTIGNGFSGGLYDYSADMKSKVNANTGKVEWYVDNFNTKISNSVLAMTTIGQVSYSAWVDGNGALRQRLGELQSGVDNGVWARMFGGKLGSDEFTNKYKTYQLGYDVKVGDWLVGAAYDYTDGSLNYTSGSGENKIGAVSLYGTLLGKDNSALDIVLKRGRIYGDMDIYGKYSDKGDYSTDATSFGVEYSKRFDAGNDVFVEPQLQLTYGRIDGYDYRSAKGVSVAYDDINSLIGRLGVVAGKEFKGGSAYVKASVLHEFSGSGAVTMLAANGDVYSADKDYGDTWLELGLGGSVALGKNFQLYGDVERSFGGDVTKHWGANLGVQYSF